ncbi:MAG: ABC transporter permease [Lachnospiraceae bacterium]|nr:ABC transporter permease [Lachnospiraceae bacterium]
MKKERLFLIPLLLGLVSLVIGLFFFGRICRTKDTVYKNYKVSLSDDTISEVFMNDNDEAAVRESFNKAVAKTEKNTGSAAAQVNDLMPADAEPVSEAEDADAAPETAPEALSETAAEEVSSETALGEEQQPDDGKDAYDTVFTKGFSQVKSLRNAVRMVPVFLGIGAVLCLIAVLMVIRAKNLDFSSIMRSKITWAAIAEILILIVCLITRPDFFNISYQPSTGMLYGSLIDIVNRSSEITIIAMGMTLVLALGGTDLSVGALVAVSGAFALKLLRWDVLIYNTPGDYTIYPFWLVIFAPLLTCTLMGCFNGFLVGQLQLQPIIATLILMVSGRGVAQILTNGKQFTTLYSPFRWIGQGSALFLPTPIVITVIVVTLVMIFVRKTAFGTFVESVGINRSASRLSGINAKKVIMIVFALTGFLSGIAGLIYSSRIMSCDSNNAGLNYETDAILAAVIGGTNMAGGKFSLAGTIIGSIIIRTIVTFVYYFGISAEATMAFKAMIIAVVIVLQSEPVRNWMAKRTKRREAAKGGAA